MVSLCVFNHYLRQNPILCLSLNVQAKSEVCYAAGYAYSYKYDKLYYSDIVKFKSKHTCSDGIDTYTKNEWHLFFASEKKKSYKYSLENIYSCTCNGKGEEKAFNWVKKEILKQKSNYRYNGFEIRKIDGFSIGKT
jgi:hypothetical protein